MDKYIVTADYDTKYEQRTAKMHVIACSSHEAENYFIKHMVEYCDALGFRDIIVISPTPMFTSLSTSPRQ
jgi:hypothetical protein